MWRNVALASVMSLTSTAPAAAQLFQVAAAGQIVSGVCATNDDIAYDPLHDAYLIIGDFSETYPHRSSCPGFRSWLGGVFVDRHGNPMGAPFVINEAISAGGVRVAFSPDMSDGAGGFGAFVVVGARGRNTSGGTAVQAQAVAYPGRLVGERTTLAVSSPVQVAVAYSSHAKRFMVAWGFGGWEPALLQTPPNFVSEFVMVGLDGLPLGPPTALASPPPADLSCLHGLDAWANTIDVVWNASAREFGVLYSQGSAPRQTLLVLGRVAPEGRLRGYTVIGGQHVCASRAKALSVNTITASYVVAWRGGTEHFSSEISPGGELIATRPLPLPPIAYFHLFALSFSPSSRTFLLAAWNDPYPPAQLLAFELDGRGVPLAGSTVAVGSIGTWHAPRAAARDGSGEWVVSLAGGRGFEKPPSDTRAGMATLAFGTGTLAAVGCVGPDPFRFFGGGTCVNGGWLPPTMRMPPPAPPPAPAPPPVGCTTPDPFAAMGGGVCVNGGWVPHNHPLARSPG